MSKQAHAGEWWRTRGGKIRYVAHRNYGCEYPIISVDGQNIPLTHTLDGRNNKLRESGVDLVEHLPDCDSFDWQPPSPPDPGDGWRLLTTGEPLMPGDEYYRDGKWYEPAALSVREGQCKGTYYRRRIEPVRPAESPDDWVTQDRVPSRKRVDQRRFISDRYAGAWYEVGLYTVGQMHGSAFEGDILEIRCRRKDLPPLPTTRAVVFTEYVVWETPQHFEIDWWSSPPQEWKHFHPTGQERTVEIPE